MGVVVGDDVAERLNQGCHCITLDRLALQRALDAEVGAPGFAATLTASHPSLFSNVPVFVAPDTMLVMTRTVEAIESAAMLPDYQAAVLAWAPEIAATDFGPAGALMGYDFHITPEGPRLIEVNTNAGGAFFNALLAEAQRGCCADARLSINTIADAQDFGARIAAMFVAEWQRQRGSGRPMTIAIVDDSPETQFLYPEFKLAQALLDNHDIDTVIVDAAELVADEIGLSIDGRRIDLVYNRLVDFGLEEPRHAALRAAYARGKVVVTPNPHVHALLADKRNLTLLSDPVLLAEWGLTAKFCDTLRATVPRTVSVSPVNADELWEKRRLWFFKPARGHGSKAAYRGDKITRKVWADILAGDYVAQAFAAPSGRSVVIDGQSSALKVDIRLYTYAGEVLLTAARLYQGQTTNMRTPGGGFAPVLERGA